MIREIDRWVSWKRELRNGKLTKVPYIPGRPNQRAKVSDPSTWGSFSAALQDYEDEKCHGIGFVLGDGVVGVDLDKCRDPETGIIEAWALTIVEELDSYTEISPSGTGVHILVTGELPPGRRRKGHTEMYSDGRYFTVTSEHLEGTPLALEERTEALATLHARVFGKNKEPTSPQPVSHPEDDEALVERAQNARNGAKFQALWIGDWKGYGYTSQSEGDLALCSMLAFWTGGEADRIDRLFRRSGLMRKKWERKDYRDGTIEAAVARRSEERPDTVIREGQRNPTLFLETLNLLRSGRAHADVPAAVHELNRARCEPPLSGPEIDELVRAAINHQPATRELLTDVGNARRFARLTQGRLLYVKRLGGWLIYENGRWIRDELNAVQEFGKAIHFELYAEAWATHDDTKRKTLLAGAIRSAHRARIEAMIKLAESIPELVASVKEFDQDPWLLNVENGVLDLQTGKLLPHDPKHRITKLAPVQWLGLDAPCPTWVKHLRLVFDGDEQLAEFLQSALGYSLTGLTTEQKLFVLHGLGANGKSVTLEVLRSVFGTYAAQTPAETLMVKRGSATNDLARLRGARFVTAVETDLEARLAEVLVKRMTGGDTVTARYLYKEFFEFEPTFKIWLAVNHKPLIYGTDHAIWRRICLIPFEVTISDEKKDPHIASKLRQEASGILAWLVRGCLRWQKEGLVEPKAVTRAVAEYRDEQDPVGAFILVSCVRAKGEATTAADLYRAYKAWTADVDEDPVARNRFGELLAERGFKKDRKGPKRATRWLGLALRSGVPLEPKF